MLEKAIASILKTVVNPVKVFPLFGTVKPPFATYTVTPVDGGVVKTSQVEVRCITETLTEAATLRQKIENKLDLKDNEPSLVSNGIQLRSSLAGGGSIFNDSIQTWELSQIFIIEWRNI